MAFSTSFWGAIAVASLKKDILRAITISFDAHMHKSYELLMFICHVAKM